MNIYLLKHVGCNNLILHEHRVGDGDKVEGCLNNFIKCIYSINLSSILPEMIAFVPLFVPNGNNTKKQKLLEFVMKISK